MSLAAQIKRSRQKFADRAAGNKDTYRFKQKKTTIRILPPWREATTEEVEEGLGAPFYHEFGQAWIKDMDKNVLAVIGDRKVTYGEDDPIRSLIQRAIGEARTDAQREHYKEMLAKARVLCNALILDDKDIDKNVPEIVEFSPTQWDTILGGMEVLLDGGDDPLSLTDGFDLIVERSGTGMQTKYTFTFARRPSSVDESVMENINNIDAFIRSKFAETDRAINALKSITQGERLQLTDRNTDMRSGRNIAEDVVEADYDAVEDARNSMGDDPFDVETTTINQDDLDALFD